ncbi:hypothetical protein [Sodalis sp. dw_96]|uniref:hypothetical protein n=1 Tax=Sodalis sp. dw_96 TaxID=2719794 RepID=UPI001BD1CEB9|nr:hypothetical protein [Sodalis sp. dw_96]
MRISPHKTEGKIIEKDLLSNSTSWQEYHEAKHLFRTLKSVRMQENTELERPVAPGKATYKNLATRLLLATSYSPIASMAGNITAQRHYSRDISFQSIDGGFFSENGGPLAYQGAGAAALPNKTVDSFLRNSAIAGKNKARRVVRSAEENESPYLPPTASAFKSLTSYLIHNSLIKRESIETPLAVINALRTASINDKGLEKIAKHLLRFSGLFGSKKNEKLTTAHQQKILTAWISSYMFNMRTERFLVEKFIELSKKKFLEKDVSLRNFIFYLSHIVKEKIMESPNFIHDTNSITTYNFIIHSVLYPIMPTLLYAHIDELVVKYPTGSLEWGYLHAGLSFAMSINLLHFQIPTKELPSLGIMLESMLREGLADLSLVRFFVMPAMLYYVKKRLDKGMDVNIDDIIGQKGVRESVFKEYFSACDEFNAIKDPIIYLSQALQSFHSRSAMAEKLININCKLQIKPKLPYFDTYQYNNYEEKCSDNSNNTTDKFQPHLNLETLFIKQNTDIVDTFLNIDRAVIYDSLTGIDINEVDFLSLSKIILLRVVFEPRVAPQSPLAHFSKGYDNLAIKENVNVFLAKQGNSSRVYALIKEKGEYRFNRIDDHLSLYFQLMKYFRPTFEEQGNIKLKLFDARVKPLKEVNDSLTMLANSVAQIHRDKLLNHLNARDDANTVDETASELFSSFIPFYNCNPQVHWTKDGNPQTTCYLNIAGLSPIAAKGSNKINPVSINKNNTVKASDEVASGLAARESLRAAIENGTLTLHRFAVLPAGVINSLAMSKLSIEFFRVFDPGLEIIGHLSGSILKQVTDSITIVRRVHPILDNILEELKGKNIKPHFNPPAHYIMAHLPALGLEIPVVKLGGDTLHGKEIYLRINPENNDIFSRKYLMDADKTLIPIPIPQGKGLRNLRPQGLGGAGERVMLENWFLHKRDIFWKKDYSDLEIVLPTDYDHCKIEHSNNSYDATVKNLEQPETTEKYLPPQFSIGPRDERVSEKKICPEYGISSPSEAIDLDEYAKAYAKLNNRQKEVIHRWTLTDSDVGLNWKLMVGETLNPEEQEIYDSLLKLSQADFSRQRGSYFHTAEYENSHCAWFCNIREGDIVTNYPQFMITTAYNNFARSCVKQATENSKRKRPYSSITYRIDNANKCTPILPLNFSDVKSPTDYFYPPQSYFLVKGVNGASEEIETTFRKWSVGVVLEELTEIPYSAKNLFTGDTYIYNSSRRYYTYNNLYILE